MAYATASEVKAFSSIAAVDAKADADLTNTYIPRAERLINAYTRQNFNLSGATTIYVDGSGTQRLELPQRLVTLTQLRFVSRSGIDGVTVVGALDVTDVLNKNWWLVLLDEPVRLRQRIGRSLPGWLTFPVGNGNVEVVGTFGYSSVPTEVKDATMMVVEKIINEEGGTERLGSPYKREKIGAYEYERADKQSRWSLIPEEARAILSAYVKPMIPAAV